MSQPTFPEDGTPRYDGQTDPAPQAPQYAAPQYAAPQTSSEQQYAPQYAAPQQPGYPQQPAYQQPYGAPQAPYQTYPAAPPTNTLAIISLVSSFFISLAGVICGHIALKQIARSGEGGRGLALAGLIIGYVGIVVGALYIIFVVAMIGIGVSSSGYDSY